MNMNNTINKTNLKTNKSGKYLLGILQNLYCSCQSEFSAFLLFNYQSLSLKQKNKKISSLLKVFAETNLKNSHILADIIISQKGLPFYLNSQASPLTAFWLNYEVGIKDVIKTNKLFLQTLINNYTLSIQKIANKKIVEKLESLKNENIKLLHNLNIFKE